MSYQNTLRGRAERKASKIIGGLLILLGVGRLIQLDPISVVGGALVIWAGAIFFPTTRPLASGGLFRSRPRSRWRESLAYMTGFAVLFVAAMVLT